MCCLYPRRLVVWISGRDDVGLPGEMKMRQPTTCRDSADQEMMKECESATEIESTLQAKCSLVEDVCPERLRTNGEGCCAK